MPFIILGGNILLILFLLFKYSDKLDNITQTAAVISGFISAIVTPLAKFIEKTGEKFTITFDSSVWNEIRKLLLTLNFVLFVFLTFLIYRSERYYPVHLSIIVQDAPVESVTLRFTGNTTHNPLNVIPNSSAMDEFSIGRYQIIPDTAYFEHTSVPLHVNWYDFHKIEIVLHASVRKGKILFKNTPPGSVLKIRRTHQSEFETANIRIRDNFYLTPAYTSCSCR